MNKEQIEKQRHDEIVNSLDEIVDLLKAIHNLIVSLAVPTMFIILFGAMMMLI